MPSRPMLRANSSAVCNSRRCRYSPVRCAQVSSSASARRRYSGSSKGFPDVPGVRLARFVVLAMRAPLDGQGVCSSSALPWLRRERRHNRRACTVRFRCGPARRREFEQAPADSVCSRECPWRLCTYNGGFAVSVDLAEQFLARHLQERERRSPPRVVPWVLLDLFDFVDLGVCQKRAAAPEFAIQFFLEVCRAAFCWVSLLCCFRGLSHDGRPLSSADRQGRRRAPGYRNSPRARCA